MKEPPRLRRDLFGDAGAKCEQVMAGPCLVLMNPPDIDPDPVEGRAGARRGLPGRFEFGKEVELHFQHALPASLLTPNP